MALPQVVLEYIKKFFEGVHRGAKTYWILPATLWNSTTVTTLSKGIETFIQQYLIWCCTYLLHMIAQSRFILQATVSLSSERTLAPILVQIHNICSLLFILDSNTYLLNTYCNKVMIPRITLRHLVSYSYNIMNCSLIIKVFQKISYIPEILLYSLFFS